MIVGFAARGFKSMANFSIDKLTEFTCLVGLNGAGKSSVLQLLDFSSHLMRGDVSQWLAKRGWSVSDLHSKLSPSSNIAVALEVKLADGSILVWGGSFNRSSLSFTTEQVLNSSSNKVLFSLVRGRYTIVGGSPTKVEFNYTGSILSALKSEVLTPEIIELKEKVSNIRSLELLSPHLMRASLREAATDIGVGGERLSSFLFGIKGEARDKLVSLLREFYPAVVDFKVKQERAGWKKL